MTAKDALCEKVLYRTILELMEDLVFVPKEYLCTPKRAHSVGTRVVELEDMIGVEDFRVELHLLSMTEKGYPIHLRLLGDGDVLLKLDMHSKRLRPSRIADILTSALFCGIERKIRTQVNKFNIVGEPPACCDTNEIRFAYAPKLSHHRFPCPHCECAPLQVLRGDSGEEDDVVVHTTRYTDMWPLI